MAFNEGDRVRVAQGRHVGTVVVVMRDGSVGVELEGVPPIDGGGVPLFYPGEIEPID